MIHPELNYYCTKRSGRLASRVWRVEKPIAEIVFLHGIISHSGWYEASCAHLAEQGFQVHFLDRRGSGLNLRDRGNVDHWSTWVSDVVEYTKMLSTDVPKLLFGISWGGILASSIVQLHPDLFAALGLICPGLFSSKATTTTQRFGLKLANLLQLNQRIIDIPLQDPALFTDSPTWRRFIAEDPLTLRQITIQFAIENLKLLHHATEKPEQITTPTLLMLAESDPITNNEATRYFVSQVSSEEKSIVVFQNASHTLEFEPDVSEYLEHLTRWCLR